ncbi:MAG: hypothetical protein RLZ98_179 [Pseudomonadota bacterium]|jgi:flavorubredoxin
MSRIENISEDVLVLTDLVPVDGRVNWLPADAEGVEPHNKYVIQSKEAVLVIDTGVAAHEESFLRTLGEVAQGRQVVVLTTRNELICSGNLGAIIDTFPDVFVVSPNGLPPVGLVHLKNAHREDIRTYRPQHKEHLSVAGFERLEIVTPVIRILNTGWVFDHETKTLFTSDFFGADMMSTSNDTAIRRDGSGLPSRDFIRRCILAKFDWLERAQTKVLEQRWEELFETYQPEVIAPAHGRVQFGRQLVRQAISDYRTAAFG